MKRRPRLERLEERRVLDARLLLTEVVADNKFGLEDEQGQASDWIEIFNAGDAPQDLTGWRLTDNPMQPAKWSFPAVTIEPDQYLVVFASGNDRRDPGSPLHTNFQLRAGGEYLALIQPDGTTVASAFSPAFPPLAADRAFGVAQNEVQTQLVKTDSPMRVFVPSADNGGASLGMAWTDPDFDDSRWTAGTGGFGFDPGGGFEDLIGTNVQTEMAGVSASAYARIPFNVERPRAYFALRLRMKYDDGYVAYLNGVEVARRNAPLPALWDSEATAAHRDSLAVQFEDVDLSDASHLLRLGRNVLAIHGLNKGIRSNDFVVAGELWGSLPGEIAESTPAYLATPTPGRPNGPEIYAGLVDEVNVSLPRGIYDEPVQTQILVNTPGSVLVYTTDGSAPTLENGTRIDPAQADQGPSTRLSIDRTTTLRVRAFRDGFLPSPTATHTYVLPNDVARQSEQATLDAGFPERWQRTPADYGLDPDVIGPNDLFDGEFAAQFVDALKAAPSVSIVTDLEELFGPEGIYVNSTRTGFDWERPTSVEMIFPQEGTSVQADAGIRIAGDNVRNFANSKKQSFRLEFRGRYGPTRLRFPVFGDDATDSFDTLILRGAYNDGWVHTPRTTQYIRDQWARTTLLEMGRPQAHGRFVHLYLNGFYWGLYNLVERPNASFSAAYFGGDKDEWDALNTGNVRDGTADAWKEFNSRSRDVADNDPQASNAALLRLLGKNPDGSDNPQWGSLVDIDHYIDYLIVNFYGGNTDWPGRNYYVGRRRGPESTGFKFYAWDTEKILDHGEGSTLTTNQVNASEGVAQAYRSLRRNEEFRLMFADHIQRHFFHGGALYVNPDSPEWDPANPGNNVPAARYQRIADQVELPLVAESARWGDTQSSATRNDRRVYTVRDWRAKRDDLYERYFPRRSDVVLKQFIRAGLYPEVAAPLFSQHGGRVNRGFTLSITGPGPVYYTLDGTDPRQSPLDPGVSESGVAPTAVLYEGPIPLNANAQVRARAFVDGEWSALNEATFDVGSVPLRITELMYHPRSDTTGAVADDDDFEFIELTNISATEPVSLGGIQFVDGIRFTFPDTVLQPAERTLVVRNRTAFESRYGQGLPIAGQYGDAPEGGKLSNGGERLKLVDAIGITIEDFTYDDAWYPSTDGPGYSLVVARESADVSDANLAESWRASLAQDGSPGRADLVDFTGEGLTDQADIDALCQAIGTDDRTFDLTGDALVDQRDVRFLVEDVLRSKLGDANLDGRFDSADLVRVFQGGAYEKQNAPPAGWASGDWNCDGIFSTKDILLAFQAGMFDADRGERPAGLPPK